MKVTVASPEIINTFSSIAIGDLFLYGECPDQVFRKTGGQWAMMLQNGTNTAFDGLLQVKKVEIVEIVVREIP